MQSQQIHHAIIVKELWQEMAAERCCEFARVELSALHTVAVSRLLAAPRSRESRRRALLYEISSLNVLGLLVFKEHFADAQSTLADIIRESCHHQPCVRWCTHHTPAVCGESEEKPNCSYSRRILQHTSVETASMGTVLEECMC